MLGAAIVPAGGVGTFLGGWLAKKFNLTRYQVCALITLLFVHIELTALAVGTKLSKEAAALSK